MSFDDFIKSIENQYPPANLPPPIEALWHQRKGDFDRAHSLVQHDPSPNAAWVHAHLHRVEGDLDNAGYWYRRAGQPTATSSLSSEWEAIARDILGG